MSLAARQCLHTTRVAQLVAYANSQGMQVKVQEWQRDLATQKMYVLQKVSKTLDSRHVDRLATDLYVVVGDEAVYGDNDAPEEHKAMYRLLGTYWESLGGRWGGRFVDREKFLEKYGREFDASKDIGWDPPHFETTLA